MRPEFCVTDDNQEVCLETNFFVGALLIDLHDEVVEEVAEEESPAPITEDIELSPTIEQQPSFEEMNNIEDSCFEEIEELNIKLDFTECQQMTYILVKNNLKHLERERLRILMENAWYFVEKIISCRDAHARTVVNPSIREYLLEAYGWKSPFGRIDLLAYVMHLCCQHLRETLILRKKFIVTNAICVIMDALNLSLTALGIVKNEGADAKRNVME